MDIEAKKAFGTKGRLKLVYLEIFGRKPFVMTILQTMTRHNPLMTLELRAGNKGGWGPPEKHHVIQSPKVCILHKSFTLALDRND
jgi:hypothetical protein